MSTPEDTLTSRIRKILFGKLDTWKQAITSNSPGDLKKFIIAELQRFEDEMGLAVQLEAEKTKIQERNLKHITDRYIQVLAMLDTVTNSNPPEIQPKATQKNPSSEMKEN